MLPALQTASEQQVCLLYHQLLACWNRRNAAGFAALFESSGSSVGFDGSSYSGRAEIESQLAIIFAHHPTPAFVGKIRTARLLTPESALVSAVASMVPEGQADIQPELNAVQSLVAIQQGGVWQIALFHNTPAAFHGRPHLSESLTAELRAEWEAQKNGK